ncbi:oxidoreductase [Atlantibacter hermannii]|uniref:oxidoreductase n=1 Tax=Atlantibacter hermannii TaxID=565 RepID=UPI00289E42D5|nr:FAD-dependent oxidoreductase [Atlantibacter hermannii]
MLATDILFQPISIRNVEIKNRYVMAPMGNVGHADAQGAFSQSAVDYFAARARGGVGLIITGLCDVAPHIEGITPCHMPLPTLNPNAFLYSAIELTERVHAWGSKIFLQLTAGFGYSGKSTVATKPVAPSPIANRWQPEIEHRALTRSEIYQFIEGFVQSAKIAQKSGFDGVEIHAVHEGYLLDQFTLAFYNHRQDEFGGSLEARLKFPVEIVKAIKAACGDDFPVALRFSLKSFIKNHRQGAVPGEVFEEKGRDVAEGLAAAKILVAAGYDALDVDAGTYDSWYWNHPPMYFGKKGIYLEFSRQVKQAVDVPVIVAGRMDDDQLARQALLNGDCDLVGLGRPLLADPDLPNKVRLNQTAAIRPCLSCHEGCMGRFARGGRLSCAVNPACGRKAAFALTPALNKKQVVVVGGGVAGMEAARVAAIRGHRVSLYEKSGALGGVVIPGGMPPFKSDDRDLLKWYQHALSETDVQITLNHEITREDICAIQPDAVIIATGSTPVIPPIKGHGSIPTYCASEVLMQTELAGPRVAIVGAGLVGAELGLWLKRLGRTVILIEASDKILGGGMPVMNADMLTDLLHYEYVEIHRETRVTEITPRGIRIVGPEGERDVNVDTVVYAVGYRSENRLWNEIKADGIESYLLGDAKRVNNIMYAIWDAFEIARNL